MAARNGVNAKHGSFLLILAVLVCAVLELQGVIGPSTGLIEELLTPKEGPVREALLAEKRQEFRESAPLRLMDRSAADGRGQALVPGDVVPEAGKLGMGEVGGAVETVAVLGAQPGADLARLLDDVPAQRGMIQPVDRAPAFGVADRLVVAASQVRHLRYVVIQAGQRSRCCGAGRFP